MDFAVGQKVENIRICYVYPVADREPIEIKIGTTGVITNIKPVTGRRWPTEVTVEFTVGDKTYLFVTGRPGHVFGSDEPKKT